MAFAIAHVRGGGELFILLSLLGLRFSRLGQRLKNAGPWLIALPVLLGIWELLTAKLALLPVPFFAPPQALLAVYIEDYARLADEHFAYDPLNYLVVSVSV